MSESHYTKDGLKKIEKLVAMKPDLLAAFMTFDGKVFEDGALTASKGTSSGPKRQEPRTRRSPRPFSLAWP